MNTLKKILKSNILWAVAALGLMLLAWHIACICIKNQYVLPDVGATFAHMFALFGQPSFYRAVGATALRTAIAFVLSFVAAAACASLAAVNRQCGVVFACIISVMRTLPTMAVTLMLLIWSTPAAAPAIVTALVLFPLVYSQFSSAIAGVDGGLLQMAKVYKLSRATRLKKIILPAVAPQIIAQTGANLSLGLKVMVSAEVLSYTLNSFGGMMQQANLNFEIARFFALVLVCIVIGLLLELVSFALNRVAFKWQPKEGKSADN